MRALAAGIAVVLATAGVARADDAVVLAPVTALGDDIAAKQTRRVESTIAGGLRNVRGISLIPKKTMLAKLKASNREDLRNCDGDASCLAQLGELLGARYVVYGEVGRVGEVQIAYLQLIDVARKKEIRSSTLELGGKASDESAHAVATKLLAPEQYTGRLKLDVDVEGATVYVDGSLASGAPARPLELSVGTHAIRVTHPEYRDFVRFVEVVFGADDTLIVPLQQYAIVSSELRRMGGADLESGSGPTDETTPWYRRWYTIAGAGAVVFISSALIIGALSDGIDADAEKTVR